MQVSDFNLFVKFTHLHIYMFVPKGLEGDMAGVVSSVSKNKSIKALNIGRNVNTMKSKHVGHVIEALVQLVQVGSRLPSNERIHEKVTLRFFLVSRMMTVC